jgi:hypothetical protein
LNANKIRETRKNFFLTSLYNVISNIYIYSPSFFLSSVRWFLKS